MLTVLILWSSYSLAVLSYPTSQNSLDGHWELFKSVYNKVYDSVEEEAIRRGIWEKHVKFIERHNIEYDLGMHSFSVGLNEYADMSNDQFARTFNGFKGVAKNHSGPVYMSPNYAKIPESIDWRKKGYVTPVGNQGECGSCWAFTSNGALEGQHFKATGKLVTLSAQNLMDCSRSEGNDGCEGGLMVNSYEYIKKNGGIDSEQSYPYEGKDGMCRYKPSGRAATDTGFVRIKKGDENDLKSACATVGPIAAAVDASHISFQLYKTGIYQEPKCSSTIVDHTVLVVGYGEKQGEDYWILKNSWGTSWGNEGYMLMVRNKNNECGIATEASYPLV